MLPLPSSSRPRVVLAEDDTLLAEALSRLLEPAFEVVGTAADGDDAVDVALRTMGRPDSFSTMGWRRIGRAATGTFPTRWKPKATYPSRTAGRVTRE